MRRALPNVVESVEELEALLAKTRDPQRKQRVHLLLLIRSGRVGSRLAAASRLAVHRNSVGDWLEKYEKGGLDAMLEIGTPGAKPGIRVLSPAVLAALRARLDGEGFESYIEVHEWLRSEYGVEAAYPTVHRIVRERLKSKLKRARPRHVKKTPATPPPFPAG